MKHNLLIGCLCLLAACKQEPAAEGLVLPAPQRTVYGGDIPGLDGADYHDRVLGALVGSAIGDAMGASTEMWHRRDIQRTYGYITGLTPAIRYQSPEGTWDHNLQAGATTDDTRWKAFMASYIENHRADLGPAAFAATISEFYRGAASGFRDEAILERTEALDSTLEKVDWIREWARVSQAYLEGPEVYARTRDRFYGGEMSCAGMLYTPVLGLLGSQPEEAYLLAYDHALFDIGYGRDIAALVAAMTQMALHTSDTDSLLNIAVFTDPLRFQDSRLVGRLSLQTALSARDYVKAARRLQPLSTDRELDSVRRIMPAGYPGSPDEWVQQEHIYGRLERDRKAIAFHAGEIWQILVAGLEFGQGDFEKTMRFIVNYGRDNDTVAAVAGMILGAQLGYQKLPAAERELVLRVNREQLGIDLEALAAKISGQDVNPDP